MGKIYAFDFDDNIAVTDARIRTTKGHINTAVYAKKRPPPHTLRRDAFVEFSRWQKCTLKPGPFHEKFLHALDERAPIAIISARNLNQKDFRKLVRRVAALGDRRLHGDVSCVCVNNIGVRRRFGLQLSAEELKAAVLKDFIRAYPSHWSLGFSDDDPRNLDTIRTALRSLSKTRRVCIYDGRNGKKQIL